MHSSLLAKSPNSPGLILVAAVSGRALAQAARRAGYKVRVADFFCDGDTLDAAEKTVKLPGSLHEGVDAGRLVGVLNELADYGLALTAPVHGSAVGARHPGNRSEAKVVRDPFRDVADYSASLRNGSRIAALRSASSDFRDDARQAFVRPGQGGIDALILGSGFERMPDLVDELARHFPLAGNRGSAIQRVKHPDTLAADCADLGTPHPAFRWEKPADPSNWISKRVGGAGGVHVQAGRRASPEDGRYFQRRVQGESISALFLADGTTAHIVGFSRQWTSPTPDAPYRYGGAVRLRRFDRGAAAMIGGWLTGLTRRTGLVGLCSADFIRNRDGYQLVEINPRPGATLDIFDSVEAPLLEAHLRACRGRRSELPRHADSMASLIAYAGMPIPAFPEVDWPVWTADRQPTGTKLDKGDPVCTIFARASSAAAAKRGALTRLKHLEAAWGGGSR